MWKWYSGPNDEAYTNGPFDTREQAVAELDGLGGYVIMARKVPLKLSDSFNVDEFLEDAEDSASDLANEDGDPIFDVQIRHKADLETRVRAAIDAWQSEHNLTFVPWVFTETRHGERIEP